MALTFPVAGVLISSANYGATERFPGPLNTSSLSPSQIFTQHTPLIRSWRFQGVTTKAPLSQALGHRGSSIFHRHKLPFIALTGLSLARGLLTAILRGSSSHLAKEKEEKDDQKAFLLLCRLSEWFSGSFCDLQQSATGIVVIWNKRFQTPEKEGRSLNAECLTRTRTSRSDVMLNFRFCQRIFCLKLT